MKSLFLPMQSGNALHAEEFTGLVMLDSYVHFLRKALIINLVTGQPPNGLAVLKTKLADLLELPKG